MTDQPRLRAAVLEGPRTILRPLRRADVAPAFAMLEGRREILDWLEWSGPAEEEDLLPYYTEWATHLQKGWAYRFAICERGDEAFVGSLNLSFAGHPGTGELGYWIEPERWGRGHGSEAVAMAAWLAFEHLDAVLLYAVGDVENHGSRRVLEKSGFVEDFRSSRNIGGRRRPTWHMSLTRRRYGELDPSLAPLRAALDVEQGS